MTFVMNLQQAYYELRFETHYLRAKGDEFQTFFEHLMSLAYKADFLACNPWGKCGDRKNDGYLKSEKRLFQVYAPNEMDASKVTKKITDDLDGAKLHWGSHFDKWSFVHNSERGLPPHVIKLLLDFGKANPLIKLETWGMEELRLILRRLSLEDLASWFGLAPTEETKAALGFKDLQVVLESIAAKPVPADGTVKPVPKGKIEANALSESTGIVLKNGMSKTTLVADFFNRWHDESLDARLAKAFRTEYERLRDTSLHPNRIYSDLQTWAGGSNRGTAEHELAVLTVLAYYFESCDIFEEPLKVVP